MPLSIPFLALLSSLAGAEPQKPESAFKFSIGIPVISTHGFGYQGQVIAGTDSSAWRFGVHGMQVEELRLFSSPARSVTSFHAITAYEVSPSPSTSLGAFGGFGMAGTVDRGPLISRDFLDARYERRQAIGPSALLGVNLGVSWRRQVGLSVNFGTELCRMPLAYTSLQLDLGNW